MIEAADDQKEDKVIVGPEEESSSPKQFRIEIRECSLAQLSSVAALLDVSWIQRVGKY